MASQFDSIVTETQLLSTSEYSDRGCPSSEQITQSSQRGSRIMDASLFAFLLFSFISIISLSLSIRKRESLFLRRAIGEQYPLPPTVILFYDRYFYAHLRGQELHLIRPGSSVPAKALGNRMKRGRARHARGRLNGEKMGQPRWIACRRSRFTILPRHSHPPRSHHFFSRLTRFVSFLFHPLPSIFAVPRANVWRKTTGGSRMISFLPRARESRFCIHRGARFYFQIRENPTKDWIFTPSSRGVFQVSVNGNRTGVKDLQRLD